jgi:hypothetical protein
MMGFLLFIPEPRFMAMVGLGGGSLAKFCHRHLPKTRIQVVEINPYVIGLRDEFQVPPDSRRFAIVQGDGAAFVRSPASPCDVLLLDGYGGGDDEDGSNSIVFASTARLAGQSSSKPLRRPRNLDNDAWTQLRSAFSRVLATANDARR